MVRFPDPQKTVKLFEERQVIVSCDQLGETLPVTSSPTLPPKMADRLIFFCLN